MFCQACDGIRCPYTSRVFVEVVFCCKQKTAYDMRISDWSSDVCSSDLLLRSTLPLGLKLMKYPNCMRSFKYALITSMIMAMATPVASQTVNLDRLLNAKAGVDYSKISRVRRASLDEVAITLGTQTGMIERANEIGSVIETRRALLDKTFRFGDLVIGQGVLPPVIVKTDNAVSVSDNRDRKSTRLNSSH